jgi:predicted transcriptional regulator YdeE
MEYEIIDRDSMTIVGISSRVDNSDAGFKSIELLWKEFFSRDIKRKLGLEADAEICEAYFDYESDASGLYTIILGALLPPYVPPTSDGLVMHHVEKGLYAKFHTANPNGIRDIWKHIWGRTDLNRRYACDFELISSQGADVYVSVK